MIIKYDQLIIIYMKFPLRDETVINTSQSKNISTNLNLSNVALFTRKSLKHICLDKLPSHFPPHSTISNHTKYFMPPLICLNCRTLTTKINDTITPAEQSLIKLTLQLPIYAQLGKIPSNYGRLIGAHLLRSLKIIAVHQQLICRVEQ